MSFGANKSRGVGVVISNKLEYSKLSFHPDTVHFKYKFKIHKYLLSKQCSRKENTP